MPLHPNLTSGYGVSVQYIYTNTQIDFYTQDRLTREKKDRKFTLAAQKYRTIGINCNNCNYFVVLKTFTSYYRTLIFTILAQ